VSTNIGSLFSPTYCKEKNMRKHTHKLKAKERRISMYECQHNKTENSISEKNSKRPSDDGVCVVC
jgi:hypothetical protein